MQVRFSFDEPEFAMIDTLFSLAEAHLFMQLVELKEERPDLLPPGKDFATMYRSAHLLCSPTLAGLALDYLVQRGVALSKPQCINQR
jgi:hypothetical protein